MIHERVQIMYMHRSIPGIHKSINEGVVIISISPYSNHHIVNIKIIVIIIIGFVV